MQFDTQEQKEITLKLIEGSQFSGQMLDIIYKYKQDVLSGEVKKNEQEKQ